MRRHTHTRFNNIKSAQYYSFIIFGIRKKRQNWQKKKKEKYIQWEIQQLGQKQTRPFVSIPVTFLVFHFDTISCSSEFHFQKCFSSVFFSLIESIYIKKGLHRYAIIEFHCHMHCPSLILIAFYNPNWRCSHLSVYGKYSSGRNQGSKFACFLIKISNLCRFFFLYPNPSLYERFDSVTENDDIFVSCILYNLML